MLQAYQARAQFRGSSDAQRGAWLRTILANVLWGTLRHYGRESRDLSREQSIAGVEHSSVRLEALLASDTSSPSQNMHRLELAAGLASALMELGEEQRHVILLKYWHDRSLNEIAGELGKSPRPLPGCSTEDCDSCEPAPDSLTSCSQMLLSMISTLLAAAPPFGLLADAFERRDRRGAEEIVENKLLCVFSAPLRSLRLNGATNQLKWWCSVRSLIFLVRTR